MALSTEQLDYLERLEKATLEDQTIQRELMSRKAMYVYLYRKAAETGTFVPPLDRQYVITYLLNRWYTYGPLQSAMDDPFTSDVTVIGNYDTIVRSKGENYSAEEMKFIDEDELQDFISRLFEGSNYSYSLSRPITDAITKDGFRVNVIGGPSTRNTIKDEEGRITTEQATILTIRKPLYPFTMDDLVSLKTLNTDMREYLRLVMVLGDSFLIGGGVGSSKTTVMNATTRDMPLGMKNAMVEELPEASPLAPWFMRLTNRDPNAQGQGAISMEDNIRNTLRMDTENVYIQELRRASEAFLFTQLYLMVKRQTASTIHAKIGFKDAIESIIIRFLYLATAGDDSKNATLENTAMFMSGKLRHFIAMRDMLVGGERLKRMTEIGEVVDYDHLTKELLIHKPFIYNYRTHDWDCFGISKDMAERLELEGIEYHLPVTAQEPMHFRVNA